MSALSIQPTYPIFTDIDGQPLEAGYVWIGQANLDPQVNPINVYWDAALTILAPQPIRTLGGYPSRNGTPARLYVNSDYSIRVMNKNGSVAYSAPAATERYNDVVVSVINAEDVVYDPPFTSASQTNVEAKLSQYVSVKDFGAVGDGVTDDSAAIQAAIDAGRAVDLGDFTNTYLVQSLISYTGQVVLFGNGATIKTNIQWLKVTDGDNSILRGFQVLPETIPFTVKRNTITWTPPAVVQSLEGYIPGGQDTDIWPISPAAQAVNATIKPLIYFTVASANGAQGLEISGITGYQLCIVVEGYTDINIHDNNFGGGQTTYGAITVVNGVSVAYNSAPLGFTLPRGLNNSVHDNNIKYASLNGIVWFGNDEYNCAHNTVSFNGESGIKTYQYDGVPGPSATIDVVSTAGRIIGNKVSDNFYDGIDAQLIYGIPFQYVFGGTVVQGNVLERNRRTGSTTNAANMVYVGNFANQNGSDGLRVIGDGNTVVGNHTRNNCQYPDGAQVFDIIIQGDDTVSVGNCIVNPIAPSTVNYVHSGLFGANPLSSHEGIDCANYCSENISRFSVSPTIPTNRLAMFGFPSTQTQEFTVATLPTPSRGKRAFVTDANAVTFGTPVVGGGVNAVPVYYNGTNWIIG